LPSSPHCVPMITRFGMCLLAFPNAHTKKEP
jgi:hypothetical protein